MSFDDKWPSKTGIVAQFCNQVRRLTGDSKLLGEGYYNSQYHLYKALNGGFGNLSDPEVYDAKVNEAIKHAEERAAEKMAQDG